MEYFPLAFLAVFIYYVIGFILINASAVGGIDLEELDSKYVQFFSILINTVSVFISAVIVLSLK